MEGVGVAAVPGLRGNQEAVQSLKRRSDYESC